MDASTFKHLTLTHCCDLDIVWIISIMYSVYQLVTKILNPTNIPFLRYYSKNIIICPA